MKTKIFKTFITVILAMPALSVAASTNYKEILKNDDNTVTIVEPRFKFFNAESNPLSTFSDFDGVCKLYGYHEYINNSEVWEAENVETTIIIDSIGKFHNRVDGVGTDKFDVNLESGNLWAIHSLMCK